MSLGFVSRRLMWVILPAVAMLAGVIGVAVLSAEGLRYQRELATENGITDWNEVIRWGVVANPQAWLGLLLGLFVGTVAGALLYRRLSEDGRSEM